MAALGSVWNKMGRLNLGLISAGIGFFAMLAIFPALAAIVMLWSLIADPAQITALLDLIADAVPPEVYQILANQVNSLINSGPSGLGWATFLSLILALWSARSGVASLIQGLNTVYGVEHRHSTIRRYLAAIGLTLLLCAVSLVAIAALIIVPVVMAFFPLGPAAAMAVDAARWVMAFAVIVFAISISYRYGPNLSGQRPGWITLGAIFAALVWLAVSIGFSFYLSNFGNYNEIYGSIGAAIALMMWFYLSAFVVLLGAALNAELRNPDANEAEAVGLGA